MRTPSLSCKKTLVVVPNESLRSLFDINPAKPDTKSKDVVLQRMKNTVTEGAMSIQDEWTKKYWSIMEILRTWNCTQLTTTESMYSGIPGVV
jgi:hypothetical protein